MHIWPSCLQALGLKRTKRALIRRSSMFLWTVISSQFPRNICGSTSVFVTVSKSHFSGYHCLWFLPSPFQSDCCRFPTVRRLNYNLAYTPLPRSPWKNLESQRQRCFAPLLSRPVKMVKLKVKGAISFSWLWDVKSQNTYLRQWIIIV